MESDRDLNWAKFYMEFADRLLDHKKHRKELVARVRKVCNNLGFDYLDKSGTADPDKGLADICPFTTMATFNRYLTVDNRRRVAGEIALFLGVNEPVPDSFDGIPVLFNLGSVVFHNRYDIDPLWRVFEDGIILAEADNEYNRRSFLDSYSQVFQANGVGRKLTIGLYWARPYSFAPLDTHSERYITTGLGVTLPSPMPMPGAAYLQLLGRLEQRFGEPDSPVGSFQELSFAAYNPSPPPPEPPPENGKKPPQYEEPDWTTIRSRIEDEGLVIDDRTLRRFHLSLTSRGFVILSGISGTGKTWLAQAYASAIGGRELLVPVAPNWTTNEDLLGYLNPMTDAYHDTEFSKFLREAEAEWNSADKEERNPVPHYLILDEMNLARVEYYFATFLSKLEVRQRHGKALIPLGKENVWLTPNLRFVGTVNVDETTHGFADKVYDRAQLVELEAPREAIQRHLADSPLAEPLLSAWDALHEVAPFGFRVIDDIRNYVDAAAALEVEVEEALDDQMLQKILPKVHGIDPRIEQALARFIELCANRFPWSSKKAIHMREIFNKHGSTSYFS